MYCPVIIGSRGILLQDNRNRRSLLSAGEASQATAHIARGGVQVMPYYAALKKWHLGFFASALVILIIKSGRIHGDATCISCTECSNKKRGAASAAAGTLRTLVLVLAGPLSATSGAGKSTGQASQQR